MLNLIDLIVAGQGLGRSKDGHAKAGNLTIFTACSKRIPAPSLANTRSKAVERVRN